MTLLSLGKSIPPETAHAVSVSLPTWNANVGYEEGEQWVVGRMTTGYPRFFIHKSIEAFAATIVEQHGSIGQKAFLFPSHNSALRCAQFLQSQIAEPSDPARIVDLYPNDADKPIICAVIVPEHHAKVAKAFWQHTGEGISSRRAEYCFRAFKHGSLATQESNKNISSVDDADSPNLHKGPRRYRKSVTVEAQALDGGVPHRATDQTNGKDSMQFVEERFGRNLDISLSRSAKCAIRKRIAGALNSDDDCTGATAPQQPLNDMPDEQVVSRGLVGLSADDVYLFPCGMNAIFHAHQLLMRCKDVARSINYGFPYIDTLKILEKFGPGCLFYGHGSESELDDLDARCRRGERFLSLFCEFPGNPLLKSPDLHRIRALADKYGFAVVVDETIGNFINVDILPFADIVVSSLTKVFTGECNVMGGSMILNPRSPFYSSIKSTLNVAYEDNYWPEDAIFMERNSRDFISRITRINDNAEAVCHTLQSSPAVDEVFYPQCSDSRAIYDRFKTPSGGYGGLLSVTLKTRAQAIAFFDHVEIAKGPSLGTNFTLCSPYVLLAHYGELEWTRQFGVNPDLVRMSIGLENAAELILAVQRGLEAAENVA